VRSSSSSSAIGLALAAGLLAGCAASAPSLPPDTTGLNRQRELRLEEFAKEDAALSCDEIAGQRQTLAAEMRAANERIEANRKQNQVAGYFGALFLVPYVATEGNYAEKDAVTRLYARQDTLIRLATAKGCRTGG
jgi:hypothetical protein